MPISPPDSDPCPDLPSDPYPDPAPGEGVSGADPDAPQIEPQVEAGRDITPDQLRRIAPYARYAWMRGRGLFRPLRQELVHAPVDSIAHLDLKLGKCIAMAGALTEPQFTDRLCRRLAEKFGAERVDPFWLEALIHQRRFEDALRWVSAEAARSPDDMAAQHRRARYAMMAGKPHVALSIWREALPRIAAEAPALLAEVVPVLIEAGEGDWLERTLPGIALSFPALERARQLAAPRGDLGIYCISLERDYRRMNATRPFLAPAGVLHRVPAVLGSALPQGAVRALVGGNPARVPAAELGCALSHLAAWERIAQDCGAQDYALVVEDDSRFLYGPGRGLEEILAVARARQAGLVFVNERACQEAVRARAEVGGVELFAIGHRFDPQAPERAPRDPGWGGDGYLLSGAGARQLCEAWAEVGVLGAVDWQLNMMSYDTLPDWHDRRITRNLYDALSARGDWPRLPGHVCTLPIIGARDFGFSTINTDS